jgi:hypothetical protein
MRRPFLLPIAMLAALAVASCDASTGATTASSTPSRSVSSSPMTTAPILPTPTQPAIPHKPPKTLGVPSPTCVQGWTTPPAGTPDATDPLGIIRRTTGEKAPFEVVDMRMFVGPESPPSVGEGAKGYLQNIRRWYVKLYAPDDLAFQGRFIVEQRVFGRGLAAVAPYDTRGFRSPDWHGFQFDSGDIEPRAIPGLPGAWTGVEYDFVKGGEGLDLPGLPAAVVGCLQATS